MLLQAASTNPSLPQSVRDEAQNVAQHAITVATRTIQAPVGAALPSCRIVSDKYNYRVGEVVVFDWASKNAEELEFLPYASGKGAFPILTGIFSPSGQYRKVVEVTGYSFIAMKASNATGQSAACSAMIHVHES